MKQNLHAIADTKYQYFQTSLCLKQVYMQNSHNYCIWIMHNEPGEGYVISELKQKKVEKIENWTIKEKEHRNRKGT